MPHFFPPASNPVTGHVSYFLFSVTTKQFASNILAHVSLVYISNFMSVESNNKISGLYTVCLFSLHF